MEASVLLGPLQSLLGWFQKNRQHQDAQKDVALEAINKALIASMKYSEEQSESQNQSSESLLEKGMQPAFSQLKILFGPQLFGKRGYPFVYKPTGIDQRIIGKIGIDI